MKKVLILAALIVAALVSPVNAQEIRTFQYEDAIQVNGRAERKITPDEIWVAITVKDTDNKSLGVDGLETRMRREFSALGIDVASALKVTSMANAPRRRHQVDTSRSYELKVGDTKTLGAVFESLGEMGVATAGVTRVSHSQIEKIRGEVRVEAVKNARTIASEMAEAVDQSINRAVWIVDNGSYESSPTPMYRTRAAMADMAEAIFSGGEGGLDMQQITLTANVMVKFVLWHK
jgi:uncharacterized protein YggE